MALSTYANLLTAIPNALHRADLASATPDFITLCEDKLNKRLRLRAMEERQTASVSAEYVSLPTGFLALRNIQINTTPRRSLEYATPDWLDIKFPSSSATGTPKFYTFVGGEIQLAPVPDNIYELEIDFYKKLDIASDSTNWLLTNAPRAYYYGSLKEACLYLKDDRRAAMYEQLLENALKEIEGADDVDLYPDTDLVIRPSGEIV